MGKQVIATAKEKMSKAVQVFTKELATIRAGRANSALLDKVTVDYYGVPTPINQLASISVPEPRLLVVQPYDKSVVSDMEKAILKSDLGVTPTSDGSVIRIVIPPLTEERRRELVKIVKKESEEAKVAIRNIRRDANDEIKKLEKGELSEDESRRHQDDIQKLTDRFIAEVDRIIAAKEKEILEV